MIYAPLVATSYSLAQNLRKLDGNQDAIFVETSWYHGLKINWLTENSPQNQGLSVFINYPHHLTQPPMGTTAQHILVLNKITTRMRGGQCLMPNIIFTHLMSSLTKDAGLSL